MKNKKYISLFSVCLAALGLASCASKGSGTTTTTVIPGESTTEDTTTATTTTTTTVAPTTTEEESIYVEYDANVSTGTTSGDYNLADDIQDGAILHAWNWSYNTIKNNLKTIAECGYSAVQTSPVQQSKSAAKSGAWTSEWSKLYQPVAFSVAEDSYLGTKEELSELCTEAKKYGVRIICDIVVNHMGNDETGKAGSYSDRIAAYEPEIAANTDTYFHQYTQSTSDSSALTVTQYELSSLPDLNTGNEYIQTRVSDLLKECIDCGVSGFRFDAAKHIETPDDGDVASNFWPTVIGTASDYASSKDIDLFCYGEILNTPGNGRKYTSYTKYMSVTDSNYSNKILSGFTVGCTKSFVQNLGYSFCDDGTKAVVWAESHDNYADGTTSKYDQEKMNRIYAIEMSHSGAAGLYFARPDEGTSMGDMGTKAWKSSCISAVNNFHNEFMGQKETASVQSTYYMNERGTEGAIIVSKKTITTSVTVTLQAGALADGTYYDQVTGNEFTVTDGTIKGKMGSSGIVVLEKKQAAVAPEITISPATGYYYGSVSDELKGTLSVKISLNYADTASYTLNDGEAVEFTGKSKVIDVACDLDSVTLKVTASNAMKSSTEEYTYSRVDYREGYAAMAGLKNAGTVSYFAWVWLTGDKNSHWIAVDVDAEKGIAYVPFTDLTYYDHYLLASFDASMTIDELTSLGNDAWSAKLGQTSDVVVTEGYMTIEKSSI